MNGQIGFQDVSEHRVYYYTAHGDLRTQRDADTALGLTTALTPTQTTCSDLGPNYRIAVMDTDCMRDDMANYVDVMLICES
jgi:hypothetical protein